MILFPNEALADPLIHLVISHLSVGEHAVNEDSFQSTMKYIFSFIEKVWDIFYRRHFLCHV